MWQKFGRRNLAVLLFGVALGAGFLHLHRASACRNVTFVNRDLACEHAPDRAQAIAELESDLRARLADRLARGKITQASVYFRNLSGEQAFGIDEDLAFVPASLLKLPLAFVYFVLESEEPGALQHELVYSPQAVHAVVPEQNIATPTRLVIGNSYSVETLLRASITHSDNLAYYLLLEHLAERPDGKALFTRTLRELGMVDPANLRDEVVSAHGYSSLFRLLYNASYLDTEASETLLSWLGASTFDQGLAAGVPRSVAVASKFGERSLADGTRYLHDCGIVYLTDEPYSLCVMTKGTDFAALEETLAEVSRVVYQRLSGSKR